jgi:hypothetical protein
VKKIRTATTTKGERKGKPKKQTKFKEGEEGRR